jgi:hypothetical protein
VTHGIREAADLTDGVVAGPSAPFPMKATAPRAPGGTPMSQFYVTDAQKCTCRKGGVASSNGRFDDRHRRQWNPVVHWRGSVSRGGQSGVAETVADNNPRLAHAWWCSGG